MYTKLRMIGLAICLLCLACPVMSEEPGVWVEPYAGIRFITIPAGCYKAEYISIADPVCVESFNMGQYEITRDQWRKVMRTAVSKGPIPEHASTSDGHYPVDYVSWNGAQQFLEELNKHNNTHVFKLPSEIEWQYACLGGLEKTLIMEGRHGVGVQDGPMPVGSYPPNRYGLYDMHGNVWEWINDFYFESYHQMPQSEIEAVQNPETAPDIFKGYKVGSLMSSKVIRGGSWFNESKQSTCAYRYRYPVNKRSRDLGFRIIAIEK